MAPSPTIRRLLKETSELSASAKNPTPAFYAAPVSDSDLHEWHFTLLGPPSPSPYAGGLYHGRITLPTSYPLKPPNFRFLTPSGRFEVNREICLSISGFHEETWMPAWGVRTALTALRTFMAEPGSAGQVGGLESPAHIRQKLAKDSRTWKCSQCGKNNEDVMREWWTSCREKGVKVDEEGGDVDLEILPEGMNLEAREKTVEDKGKQKESTEQQSDSSSHSHPDQPPSAPSIPAIIEPEPHLTQINSRDFPPPTPTPDPESIQAAAESHLTSTNNPPSDRPSTRPMMNLHAPPLAAANAALQQEVDRRNGITNEQSILTLDRAIAGVFVALILMLLKKVFYPARSGELDFVDGNGGGFYMEREF